MCALTTSQQKHCRIMCSCIKSMSTDKTKDVQGQGPSNIIGTLSLFVCFFGFYRVSYELLFPSINGLHDLFKKD